MPFKAANSDGEIIRIIDLLRTQRFGCAWCYAPAESGKLT
jgi:hypothetical protein